MEYRRAQLQRLQEEVVDIEDMSSGISIMDLGLNEFRMGLLDYLKRHGDLDAMPRGLHAVVAATDDAPPGVIFVLKNCGVAANAEGQNRLHPFYLVYIAEDGEVVCDHLSPKEVLTSCVFFAKIILSRTRRCVSASTRKQRTDGAWRRILRFEAIDSIVHVKEESELDAFLRGNQMSFLRNVISGLEDFELMCFLVVQGRD